MKPLIPMAAIALAVAGAVAWSQPPQSPPILPNARTTPGAANPKITQSNMRQYLCPPHTRQFRPPEDYTEALKRQQLQGDAYQSDRRMGDYEEDHLIPLEIGGDPKSPKNLWPQFRHGICGALVKDHLEDKLNVLVCNGTLTLYDAQHAIASDWVGAYNKYMEPLQCPSQ